MVARSFSRRWASVLVACSTPSELRYWTTTSMISSSWRLYPDSFLPGISASPNTLPIQADVSAPLLASITLRRISGPNFSAVSHSGA